jgi:hypothetical protein
MNSPFGDSRDALSSGELTVCSRSLVNLTVGESDETIRCVLLALVVCAQARAEVQSWQFRDASLFADDGFNAFFTGPAET